MFSQLKIILPIIAVGLLGGCQQTASFNSYDVRSGQYMEGNCNLNWCSTWSKNTKSGQQILVVSSPKSPGFVITSIPKSGLTVRITSDDFFYFESSNINFSVKAKNYNEKYHATISKRIDKTQLKPYEYVEGMEKYRTVTLTKSDSLKLVKDMSELWDEVIITISDGNRKYTIRLTAEGNRANYLRNAYLTAL